MKVDEIISKKLYDIINNRSYKKMTHVIESKIYNNLTDLVTAAVDDAVGETVYSEIQKKVQ